MEYECIEKLRCKEYLSCAEDEQPFTEWLKNINIENTGLLVAEGFEERSLGIMERLAKAGVHLQRLAIGRYVEGGDLNVRFRSRFEKLAEIITPGKWSTINNHNDGKWVSDAIKLFDDIDNIILDITGLSNIGMFGVLDIASLIDRSFFIAYTEADQYWPKKDIWEKLKKDLTDPTTSIAEIVDQQPWLFGYEHRVVLIPGHEGYDSGGSGRALIGFLPFKCARLAAVLGKSDYSEVLFIAGRPRLEMNSWRLEALKIINAPITKEWPVEELSTFGYRNTIEQFSNLVFLKNSLLQRYDTHLAVMGSKLQTIACWVLSTIVRSITAVTSIPATYYPEAFSEGIGTSWIFKLVNPKTSHLYI